MEWPCLMLVFCENFLCLTENTKVQLWVPGQFQVVQGQADSTKSALRWQRLLFSCLECNLEIKLLYFKNIFLTWANLLAKQRKIYSNTSCVQSNVFLSSLIQRMVLNVCNVHAFHKFIFIFNLTPNLPSTFSLSPWSVRGKIPRSSFEDIQVFAQLSYRKLLKKASESIIQGMSFHKGSGQENVPHL